MDTNPPPHLPRKQNLVHKYPSLMLHLDPIYTQLPPSSDIPLTVIMIRQPKRFIQSNLANLRNLIGSETATELLKGF
jgi:hypothetical protein